MLYNFVCLGYSLPLSCFLFYYVVNCPKYCITLIGWILTDWLTERSYMHISTNICDLCRRNVHNSNYVKNICLRVHLNKEIKTWIVHRQKWCTSGWDEFFQKVNLYLKRSSIHMCFGWFISGCKMLTFSFPFIDSSHTSGGPIWAVEKDIRIEVHLKISIIPIDIASDKTVVHREWRLADRNIHLVDCNKL